MTTIHVMAPFHMACKDSIKQLSRTEAQLPQRGRARCPTSSYSCFLFVAPILCIPLPAGAVFAQVCRQFQLSVLKGAGERSVLRPQVCRVIVPLEGH
jgi:hypothetical protein